ncbi:MAG: hypothetical protein LQ349_002453 [Xanthoria aureola]|nr:MAG: hypothetical protein LQ349_007505 [Xanthoria aureola]KAI4236601.1 MAG: hypothetical protein LQ349_002453 [Xanthoria aureola]
MYYDPVTREYYDDPSDEEDIRGDYAPNDEHARSAHRALYAYARPLGGAPFTPPTVCHSGCRTLTHRIPSGGLPSGASLGLSHRIAVQEALELPDEKITDSMKDNIVDVLANHTGMQRRCRSLALPWDDTTKLIPADSDYENLPEVLSCPTKSKTLTIFPEEIVQLEDVRAVPMEVMALISVNDLMGIIVIMQYLLLLGQADVTVVRKEGMEVGGDLMVDMGKGVRGVMW